MKKTLLGFTLIIVLIAFLSSCDKDESLTLYGGMEYIRVDSASWIEYSVDSIFLSDAAYPVIRFDTVHYEIREVVDSTFKDLEGRDAYRITRYRRPSSASAWRIDRVWSAALTSKYYEKNEDDIIYVKLAFPLEKGSTWKGNAKIAPVGANAYLKDWTYTCEDIHQSWSSGTLNFDSTLHVIQHDEENLIEKRFSEERYAKGVGLVYKRILWLEKQNNLSNGWEFPESGLMVIYRVIAHS